VKHFYSTYELEKIGHLLVAHCLTHCSRTQAYIHTVHTVSTHVGYGSRQHVCFFTTHGILMLHAQGSCRWVPGGWNTQTRQSRTYILYTTLMHVHIPTQRKEGREGSKGPKVALKQLTWQILTHSFIHSRTHTSHTQMVSQSINQSVSAQKSININYSMRQQIKSEANAKCSAVQIHTNLQTRS